MAAAPERGAANLAVVELVATTLGVHKRAVRLVSGFASRDKIVEVDGLRRRGGGAPGLRTEKGRMSSFDTNRFRDLPLAERKASRRRWRT